jgi:pyruvate/2-oxoglutarate/acetoin dehydrogenase E1 component
MEKLVKDPWHRNRKIRDGIYTAIYSEMLTNDRVYLIGEGAHMKVHFDAPKIEAEFPGRALTLGISEDGNSNFAVGMALADLVPIVDVISSDFLFRTMDAICNTMAKLSTVQKPKTIIVKAEFLTGGPTSGQRIEAMFTHVPGLRVVIPSNPIDAHHAMEKALHTPAITVFFEDRMIKDEWFNGTEHPNSDLWDLCERPLATSSANPSQCTVISYGITHVLAGRALKDKPCTLFGLTTLCPLNLHSILPSMFHTKKVLIVEPDATFMGIGAEIVAQLVDLVPDCKFKRIGGPRSVIPASRELHDLMIPSEADILTAYEELTKP